MSILLLMALMLPNVLWDVLGDENISRRSRTTGVAVCQAIISKAGPLVNRHRGMFSQLNAHVALQPEDYFKSRTKPLCVSGVNQRHASTSKSVDSR